MTTTPEPPRAEPPKPSPFPTTTALLTHLYTDVTLLASVSSPRIILHPANRYLTDPPAPSLIGIAAAQAHEEALVAATHGTLVMDVSSICANREFGCVLGVLRAGSPSSSDEDGDGGEGDGDGDEAGNRDNGSSTTEDKNERSGCGGQKEAGIEGKRRERRGETEKKKGRGTIAMPFCGVWKFDEQGWAVEHWENAADAAALEVWLKEGDE